VRDIHHEGCSHEKAEKTFGLLTEGPVDEQQQKPKKTLHKRGSVKKWFLSWWISTDSVVKCTKKFILTKIYTLPDAFLPIAQSFAKGSLIFALTNFTHHHNESC